MKKIILSIVIIVILGLLVWRWQASQPAAAPSLEGDTTGRISEQLEGLDLGELDSEFQTIDSELNNL